MFARVLNKPMNQSYKPLNLDFKTVFTRKKKKINPTGNMTSIFLLFPVQLCCNTELHLGLILTERSNQGRCPVEKGVSV